MFDLSRIIDETFVSSIDFHDSIGSTNDRALEIARTWKDPLPCLILTPKQTGGRGRGANVWWSSEGSLTFSVLIDAQDIGLPQSIWPQVSLASGLAVCESLAEFLPGKPIQLKWPNDVFVESRKASGLLVEVPDPKASGLVIGIGINVNNSVQNAPPQLQAIATAMTDEAGGSFEMTSVLVRVLQELERQLRRLVESAAAVRADWSNYCLLTGRTVTIRRIDEETTGRCRGIDDEGALVLEARSGIERIRSGVVVRYE